MDKFQNDPTYEYRKSSDRPDLAVNEISMHSCTDYVLHNELTRKKDGAIYHTTDKNEFWYDWKGKRYKLSWLGADTSDLQKQIDAIKKQVAALDGKAAAEAIENAKKALTMSSEAKQTADGLSSQIATAVADAAGAKSDAADAVKTAGEAKSVADGLSDRVDAAERVADVANDKATEAMAVAYDAKAVAEQAKAAGHTHDNKSELDLIGAGDKAKWDAATITANEAHEALERLEEYANTLEGSINTTSDNLSAHINDTTDKKHISAKERADWNEAYQYRHTHTNKDVLDGITSEKTSAWDNKQDAIDNIDILTTISQGDVDRWNGAVSAAGVSSIDGKSGAITLSSNSDINLSISEDNVISAVLVGNYLSDSDYGIFPDSSDYIDYPGESDYMPGYAKVEDVVKFVTDILKKNETVTDTGKEYLYINALKISAIDDVVDASRIPDIYQFVEYEITPDADGSFEIIVVCNQEIEGYDYGYAVDYGAFVTIEIPSTYEIVGWKVVGITGWEDPVTPFGVTNPKYAKRMYGSVEYSSYVRTLDYAEIRNVDQRYKITIKKK